MSLERPVRTRFTKKADGRHRLTVVRDDGSTSQGKMVPGLGIHAIPHDLLHALVEQRLGLAKGVYGMVNTGLDIAALLDPAQKRMNRGEIELQLSEVITNILQGEAVYTGVEQAAFRDGLRRRCEQHGVAVPAISGDQLRDLRALRDDYQQRWRALEVGETIEVELAE